MAGRVRLRFARGLVLEFRDRRKALRQLEVLAERGTYPVYVVYGPEGCGRTALLLQAKAILEEDYGYHVVYVNPLAGEGEAMLIPRASRASSVRFSGRSRSPTRG